jgi:predicted TIM-barrel fold metal-dependent hydrolase
LQKFIGGATVPPQDIDASVAELACAVIELKLQGVEIRPNVWSRYLGDPIFLPFFEKARALDVPLFIHSRSLRRLPGRFHFIAISTG